MFKGGAGALNRLITLQRLPTGSTRNDIGEIIGTPQDEIADIRAAYEPLGGREFPEAEKRHAETKARFRIRYRTDLNVQALPETHRVLYVEDYETSPRVTRVYDIKEATVIDRKEIHIEVSEIR